jgi:uncharacterized membrane protein
VSFNEFLEFIHVLAAVVWVGGSIGLMVHAIRVMSVGRGDDASRLDFLRHSDLMGRVFMASGITVAVAGIWLVIRVDAWGFDEFWISFAFAVVIASALLGMFFFPKQGRRALAIGEEQGTDSAAFKVASRRIGQIATVENLFLIAVVWAMVTKPGA